MIKQLMKFEYELAHAQDEQLASVDLLDQAEARAQASEQRVAELQQEHHELQAKIKKLSKHLTQVANLQNYSVSEEEFPMQSEHDSLLI